MDASNVASSGGGLTASLGNSNNKQSSKHKHRLQIIENSSLTLKGQCVYFTRNSPATEITAANISNEVCSGSYDCQSSESVLKAIGQQLTSIFLPALTNLGDAGWGQLGNSKDCHNRAGEATRSEYLGRLQTFVGTLSSAQAAIDERIIFRPCERIDLSQVIIISAKVHNTG
jgi:hypothetical protein